jgi:hypothetical protein
MSRSRNSRGRFSRRSSSTRKRQAHGRSSRRNSRRHYGGAGMNCARRFKTLGYTTYAECRAVERGAVPAPAPVSAPASSPASLREMYYSPTGGINAAVAAAGLPAGSYKELQEKMYPPRKMSNTRSWREQNMAAPAVAPQPEHLRLRKIYEDRGGGTPGYNAAIAAAGLPPGSYKEVQEKMYPPRKMSNTRSWREQSMAV